MAKLLYETDKFKYSYAVTEIRKTFFNSPRNCMCVDFIITDKKQKKTITIELYFHTMFVFGHGDMWVKCGDTFKPPFTDPKLLELLSQDKLDEIWRDVFKA
jgi:hypothetical protein